MGLYHGPHSSSFGSHAEEDVVSITQYHYVIASLNHENLQNEGLLGSVNCNGVCCSWTCSTNRGKRRHWAGVN